MVLKGAEMNLGFYIHSTTNNELNSQIFSLLNEAIEDDLVDDASLFYNEVDFNPNIKKFGTFNSTEMWSFSGTLVVTSLKLLSLASKVVNKIKLVYLHNKENFEYGDVTTIMDLINLNPNIKVVAKDEHDAKEYTRLTGKEIGVIKEFNAKEILEV